MVCLLDTSYQCVLAQDIAKIWYVYWTLGTYVLAHDIAKIWDVYWTLVTSTYLLRTLPRNGTSTGH
jgi:hypothetical protein